MSEIIRVYAFMFLHLWPRPQFPLSRTQNAVAFTSCLRTLIVAISTPDRLELSISEWLNTAHWASLSPKPTTGLTAFTPISSHPATTQSHTQRRYLLQKIVFTILKKVLNLAALTVPVVIHSNTLLCFLAYINGCFCEETFINNLWNEFSVSVFCNSQNTEIGKAITLSFPPWESLSVFGGVLVAWQAALFFVFKRERKIIEAGAGMIVYICYNTSDNKY